MDPKDPRETLATVRPSLRPEEPWRSVLFAARFAQFRPQEVAARPEEEKAHRLVWMGWPKALDSRLTLREGRRSSDDRWWRDDLGHLFGLPSVRHDPPTDTRHRLVPTFSLDVASEGSRSLVACGRGVDYSSSGTRP